MSPALSESGKHIMHQAIISTDCMMRWWKLSSQEELYCEWVWMMGICTLGKKVCQKTSSVTIVWNHSIWSSVQNLEEEEVLFIPWRMSFLGLISCTGTTVWQFKVVFCLKALYKRCLLDPSKPLVKKPNYKSAMETSAGFHLIDSLCYLLKHIEGDRWSI